MHTIERNALTLGDVPGDFCVIEHVVGAVAREHRLRPRTENSDPLRRGQESAAGENCLVGPKSRHRLKSMGSRACDKVKRGPPLREREAETFHGPFGAFWNVGVGERVVSDSA